jgi:hypothetical protein
VSWSNTCDVYDKAQSELQASAADEYHLEGFDTPVALYV